MTLCFPVQGNPPVCVLLGYKKAGFGAGKYAGIGGRVETGESVFQAAVRELGEEIDIKAAEDDLKRMGHLTFLFPAQPAWSQRVHVFLVEKWEGDPAESEEMIPVWFDVDHIPYEQMWQDAVHWLAQVLNKKRVRGCFTFGEDNETVDEVQVHEVERV
jgi:8-oxo-dGTP diphosphatase